MATWKALVWNKCAGGYITKCLRFSITGSGARWRLSYISNPHNYMDRGSARLRLLGIMRSLKLAKALAQSHMEQTTAPEPIQQDILF